MNTMWHLSDRGQSQACLTQLITRWGLAEYCPLFSFMLTSHGCQSEPIRFPVWITVPVLHLVCPGTSMVTIPSAVEAREWGLFGTIMWDAISVTAAPAPLAPTKDHSVLLSSPIRHPANKIISNFASGLHAAMHGSCINNLNFQTVASLTKEPGHA